jgi:hypothetical protein
MTDLDRYREDVRRLTAENEALRKAAHTFGELAERLNDELRRQRHAASASTQAHDLGMLHSPLLAKG